MQNLLVKNYFKNKNKLCPEGQAGFQKEITQGGKWFNKPPVSGWLDGGEQEEAFQSVSN